jgi:hypothetical protein
VTVPTVRYAIDLPSGLNAGEPSLLGDEVIARGFAPARGSTT